MGGDSEGMEDLVASGLPTRGLDGEDRGPLRNLDIRKQVVTWWVRKQTMVSNRWLSERLCMGDEGNISKVIQAVEHSKTDGYGD